MAFDQSDENLDSIIILDFSNIKEPDDSFGKRKRATSEQLEKLISFANIHPDFTKGSNKEDADQDIDWQNLTAELNAMGPPIRTCKEWRTAWSQYKGNKKRSAKRLKADVSSTMSCSHEKKGTSIAVNYLFFN